MNDQKARKTDQDLISQYLCYFVHEKPHAKRCKMMRNFFASFRIVLGNVVILIFQIFINVSDLH